MAEQTEFRIQELRDVAEVAVKFSKQAVIRLGEEFETRDTTLHREPLQKALEHLNAALGELERGGHEAHHELSARALEELITHPSERKAKP